MTSGVPPAIRKEKPYYDRDALLVDAAYFAKELAIRLERIETLSRGHNRVTWQQAAALARGLRGKARQEIDWVARQRKLAQR